MVLEELTPSGETGATARDKINLAIQRVNEFETFPAPPTADGEYTLKVEGGVLTWIEVSSSESKLLTGE